MNWFEDMSVLVRESVRMVDSIEELEKVRDELNVKAEEHRTVRDRLNDETKKLVEKRDMLNDQVKKLVHEANQHRDSRNKLNDEVKSAKVLREELNRKANDAQAKVATLKRERLPKGGDSLAKLKKDLKNLEFKQMTSVLTSDKEKELIEILGKIQQQIREKEKLLEENADVKAAIKDANQAKADAEKQHAYVSELADKAQKEHDIMVKLYEESDELRKQADSMQEQFLKTKQAADEEHRKHIELIRQVHDYDKIIFGMRQKEKKDKKSKIEANAKKQVNDLFERFKKGEKLSTEDLMALQTKGP